MKTLSVHKKKKKGRAHTSKNTSTIKFKHVHILDVSQKRGASRKVTLKGGEGGVQCAIADAVV